MKKTLKELVDSINSQEGRKDRIDADTLCDFGNLGLETPRNIVTAFWNSFKKE